MQQYLSDVFQTYIIKKIEFLYMYQKIANFE